MFCLALAWLLAASLAAWAFVFVIRLVVGMHNGARPRRMHAWYPERPHAALLMLLVADVIPMFAGWRRGAAPDRGDARVGLCFGPIRRPGLLLGLATEGQAAVFGWAVAVYFMLPPADHGAISALLAGIPHASAREQAATLCCAIVLSPLWEEFFFRGWLWTGVRRYWSALAVMVATTVAWLWMHRFDGLLRPLYLLPMGGMLCLARQYCGGIRASITLHVLNNLIAIWPVLLVHP